MGAIFRDWQGPLPHLGCLYSQLVTTSWLLSHLCSRWSMLLSSSEKEQPLVTGFVQSAIIFVCLCCFQFYFKVVLRSRCSVFEKELLLTLAIREYFPVWSETIGPYS